VAAMRSRLLDATLECLQEQGYSAMSTNDVVRRARVSRGALAHHFPTKADLVRAAAERLIEQRGAEFRERLRSIEPERRTVAEALDVLWSMYEDASAAALIELTVAARHKLELRAVISEMPGRIAKLTGEMVREFFPDLAALPFVEQSLYALHAFYGGLALNGLSGDEDLARRGAEVRRLLNAFASSIPSQLLAGGSVP
jgi:AcrR family transcriptional regulator